MSQHLSPEELGKLFFEIDSQPSLKLSELAKIAGLSLAEDYIGADLSDEDLSEDNLAGANLSNANLSNTNLRSTNLYKANLCSAVLKNADLSYADLSYADLSNANLSNANLFRANLDNANLSNASLSYVNFGCANLLNAKNLTTANLSHAILTTATLGLSQKERLILKQQGVIVADAADSFSNVQGSVIQGNQKRIVQGNDNQFVTGNNDTMPEGIKKQFNFNDAQIVASQEQAIANARLRVLTTTAAQVSTAVSEYGQYNFSTASEAEKLSQYWRKRLAVECSEQSVATRESIVLWLLGGDRQRFDLLNSKQLDIAKQAMEYRYRILLQRYLGIGRKRAYHNLITRLGSLVTLRNKIQTWVSLSRDRQRSVIDVLQEVIQELLQSDTYIQEQMASIAQLTNDKRLRDTLLFASIEEYSLRPVRNQPLLAYCFVNYLRRTQRGGLTQVPASDLIRLVSEEILAEDSDNRVHLLDSQAIAEYQEAQEIEEQLALRQTVQQEFEKYLQENLGQEAVDWLQMYLQGKSQDEIARKLNKPIKEIYRLREKISYHAVRVFALKGQTELVDNWLSTSIQEHNLGLTQNQWQQLNQQLSSVGQQLLDLRKAGHSIEAIAEQLKLKTHQVMGEWTKIYLAAQALRTQE